MSTAASGHTSTDWTLIEVATAGLDRAAARAAARAAIASAAAERRGIAADAVGADAVRVHAVCPDCGGDHGQPLVTLPAEAAPVFASVTHPGDRTLVVIGDRPLGIDAEQLGARTPDGLATTLGLESAPPPGEHALLAAWTAAEAVLKADGRGLRVDPRRIVRHPGALAELDGRWFHLPPVAAPVPLSPGAGALVVSLAIEVPPPAAGAR